MSDRPGPRASPLPHRHTVPSPHPLAPPPYFLTGPRSIQQIFRIAVFVLLPTALELVAVCAVLTRTFSPVVGALVGATFIAYVAWSVTLTQVRVVWVQGRVLALLTHGEENAKQGSRRTNTRRLLT